MINSLTAKSNRYLYPLILCASIALGWYAGKQSKKVQQPPCSKKVMVSGCFDLLHSGHIAFFKEAASHGELYVMIGNDKNINHLKGHKPMFPEEERRSTEVFFLVKKKNPSRENFWISASENIFASREKFQESARKKNARKKNEKSDREKQNLPVKIFEKCEFSKIFTGK